MMHCLPNVTAPIVHPPRCNVLHHFEATIVPHIHPSHTMHVYHHLYEHQHYFPHTESAVAQAANRHLYCPGPGPMPFPPFPLR
ncbi:spore coat protein CotH [Geobacillus thermoleovorans]|uniref:Spore coat protein CotH n=4 Tax=Geobacillus TaxID=129337 RepID=A0A7U9J8R4_GEOTM|nr:spore coat protein [Geobacillus sp. GHH01]AKM18836.1 Inner spore coat protein D [Geobacillus sp. 12AMOR1]AUI35526.1 spore coat protein CotH [[Bacillus] caldolyticus]AWO76217.1 spore coat protein CotH [Geobacillus thermoleovorans]ESU70968.1 spore coat protein CotH [Geobacillus sp. MAS1]PJW13664.1 spore coat protein CotH [Geobacillus sp. Manikaran-105]PJW16758.1 spore coat protein CotH [Geobacillus sp. WSUCF-018B]QCK82800.1 spore coat protein CotH [Geobacillus kaustophilus NBRC 102445]QOR8